MQVRRIVSVVFTDVLLPVVVFAVVALRIPDRWTSGLIIAVVMGVALRVRRCLPVAAVVIAALAQTALVWEGVPAVGAPGVIVVLFSASLTLGPRMLVLVAAAAMIGLGAAEIGVAAARGGTPDVLPLLLVFAFGVAGGLAWRYYRSYVASAAQEAAASARVEAAEHRVALSRELHDSIGHQLAVINLHAQVAAVAVDSERARVALGHVAEATRTAMSELSELVAQLRDGNEPLRPADLDELRAGLVAAGTLGTFEVEMPTVVPATERAAFRIVQESITNAGRHAPGAVVDVRVAGDDTEIDVRVRNGPSGMPPPPIAGGGHGLAGLRERVTTLGGTIDAAPTDDGGFEVRARLPIGAAIGGAA
ncbi:sensor histidine kinase [Microbacterium sp.]|uniref:sensor histidine kinase n=1 Tax=Microbacterium sp. TaxID=51671 RepID=UPI003A87A93C